MNTHRIASCVGLPTLLLVSACQTTQARDLTQNTALYAPTGFRTGMPGDREVFVTPLADARDVTALPASSGAFPITYDPDGRWQRPVRAMVEELLHNELRDSNLFARLLPRAEPRALVLKPTLVRFHSATMETMEGGRSMAEVAVRLQIYGPADAAGRRQIWHDQVYGESQVSPVRMVPVSTFILTGRATRSALERVLNGLDGSNIGRSGVPLDFAEPAPVAPPAPAPAAGQD